MTVPPCQRWVLVNVEIVWVSQNDRSVTRAYRLTSSLTSKAYAGVTWNTCSIICCMSATIKPAPRPYGQALLAAQEPAIDATPASFGRSPTSHRTGVGLAGAWFAQPLMRFVHGLIAPEIRLSGPIDPDELEHWLQIGWAEPVVGADAEANPSVEYDQLGSSPERCGHVRLRAELVTEVTAGGPC